MNTPSKEIISEFYLQDGLSSAAIAEKLECSTGRINYWIKKYKIKKRTIAEAIYKLKNPLGDPFVVVSPKTLEEGILFGLGLGLYWGEGAKRGDGGLRLTNTDPKMIIKFIYFLEKFFRIDKNKLRFSIQIHKDISQTEALKYWAQNIRVSKDQFYKTIVSKVRGRGTYKEKSKHGVVIIYFNNIKLKKVVCGLIDKIV